MGGSRFQPQAPPRAKNPPNAVFRVYVKEALHMRLGTALVRYRDGAGREGRRSVVRYARMRKVLVTGGAGFLGSHLCDRLVLRGDHVLCTDDFSSGSEENVRHLAGHPRFELRRHDVTSPLDAEVHEIFNFACPASPMHYQADPVRTIKTSVDGAIQMLDLARRTGARVLQASTAEVYGDPDVQPQSEGYWGRVNFTGPRGCYDEGKRCAETLFFDLQRRHGVDIKVLRIFNTYGPRMDPNDGRVVSNFVVQALRGQDLTVYGEGLQTRSFCYVDDLTDAVVRMMDSEAGFFGPVNAGTPDVFTMIELAEKVLSLTGSRSRLVHRPLPKDDPLQRRPDITLAREKLGWWPRVTLEDGLKETIAWFRKVLVA